MKDKLEVIICDIDGTIADNDHRLFKREGEILWDVLLNPRFVPLDKPIYPVKIFLMEQDSVDIIYISGRYKKFRRITKNWLKKYGFPSGKLILKRKQYENDYIFKERVIKKVLKKYKIKFILEDLEHNIKMFERYNLKVINPNEIVLNKFYDNYFNL